MSLIEPLAAGNEMLLANSQQVMPAIVPLFVPEGRRIKLLGSGVYLRLEDRDFLVTAAHVIDESRSLITALEPERVGSLPAVGYFFYREWADVAITELSAPLTQFEPLQRVHIQNYDLMPKRMPLFGLGFPSSKTRIYSSTADCTVSVVISQEEDDEHYLMAGADRRKHIAITFNKRDMRSANGQQVQAPDVYGMSGGGLFWIHGQGRVVPSPAILVGILTHWDDSSLTTLVATKMTALNPLLKESHSIRLF